MISRPRRKSERLIEFVVCEVFVFIKQTFPFFDWLILRLVGLKEGRSCRGGALSRIQILVFTDSAKNLANLSNQFAVSAPGRFNFEKRSQLFIGLHNEPLSVAPICVRNPDPSLRQDIARQERDLSTVARGPDTGYVSTINLSASLVPNFSDAYGSTTIQPPFVGTTAKCVKFVLDLNPRFPPRSI